MTLKLFLNQFHQLALTYICVCYERLSDKTTILNRKGSPPSDPLLLSLKLLSQNFKVFHSISANLEKSPKFVNVTLEI